jgi:hypothetical protein
MSIDDIAMDDLITRVKILSPKPGDLIAICTSEYFTKEETRWVSETLLNGGIAVPALILFDESDVMLLDEERMAAWGWVRADRLPDRGPHPVDTEYLGAGA